MTRLATKDFEGASPTADGFAAWGADARGVYTTGPKFRGNQALQISAATATRRIENLVLANPVGRTLYTRSMIRFPAAPAGGSTRIFTFEGAFMTIFLTTGRQIQVETASGSQAAIATALAVDTFYRLETRTLTVVGASDVIEVRIYEGASTTLYASGGPYTASATDTAITNLLLGVNTTAHTSPFTIIYDSFAVNDDQGVTDNTWVGPPDPDPVADNTTQPGRHGMHDAHLLQTAWF